jgi:Carboxypeptidase regulatory-like domain
MQAPGGATGETRKEIVLITTTALAGCLALGGTPGARAADAALTGKVTSIEEGAMEGVVVSARKEGSTIRISVVTDAQGQFSFPATILDPGSYKISIRAAGYDLEGIATANVEAIKTATADLRLTKTRDLTAQLTNADWISSLPDQPARRGLSSCTTCHTVQRVLDSTHTADEFTTLIPRMMRYGAMSRPHRPQTPADRNTTSAPEVMRSIASPSTLLASIAAGAGCRASH